MHEKAPAKINLGLCITGKRPDGFHDILSLFQTVDLCDNLSATGFDGKRLTCNNSDLPVNTDNLVVRAEDLFCERFGIKRRLSFNLDKRIPVGGGLGGGSSDGAAALRLLQTYHGVESDDRRLMEIAAELGSDIPFLVRGGTGVVSGRGEVIEEISWPFDFSYVLVHPGFGVSTAWAYRSMTDFGQDADRYGAMIGKLRDGSLARDDFFSALTNDFERVVFEEHPVLGTIRDDLLAGGARAAMMTGSGSTMLGIFEDHDTAEQCAESMHGDKKAVFLSSKFNIQDSENE